MKFLRVISASTPPGGSWGRLDGDSVSLLSGPPYDGRAGETGVSIGLREVEKFLPPAEPPNIAAIGLNYAGHARESGMDQPAEPVVFLKATSALTGHLSPVVLPPEHPLEVDYEAELAVVMGKTAKNVGESEAGEYIFGYTCANDVSARDCQMRLDRQWARAKSFDTFAPLGPWVETNPGGPDLKITSRLNGVMMQDASTSDLFFSVPALVSFLSRSFTLLPGTVIMTGTPAGVGFGRNPPVYLKPGDTVEIEIEGIGVLTNPVEAGQ